MNTPLHTPGPWIVDIAAFSCYRSISTAARPPYEQIAEIPWAEPSVFDAERNANARLIAAAPELLAALQAMLLADSFIADNVGTRSDQAMGRIAAIDQAFLAVLKAKGEVSS